MEQNKQAKAAANEFVFHNNAEFEAFQKNFSFVNGEIVINPNAEPMLYPCDVCDYVHMTFMYNNGERYNIISNLALAFQNYREIKIQGSRSHWNSDNAKTKAPLPILQLYNECALGATQYYDYKGSLCHSYNCDDAIFNIQNEHSTPVDILISDLEIRAEFSLAEVESLPPIISHHEIDSNAMASIDNNGDSDLTIDTGKTTLLYTHWFDKNLNPVLFKVYEASSFRMFNVKLYSQFLNITHVFLHWCENVEIVNCVFENYNARKVGGNLWLWDRTKNVRIENNDFYKYGNDESIAIWGSSCFSKDEDKLYKTKETLSGLDDFSYANRIVNFENIHIKNNRFFYGKPISGSPSIEKKIDTGQINSHDGLNFPDRVDTSRYENEEKWDGVCDFFCTMFFAQLAFRKMGTNDNTRYSVVPYVHYKIKDYCIDGNEFYIDAPIKNLTSFSIDDYCESNDISISSNYIRYGTWKNANAQLVDFRISCDDLSGDASQNTDLGGRGKFNLDQIRIADNTIDCRALSYMIYSNSANSNENKVNTTSAKSTIESSSIGEIPLNAENEYTLSEEHYILKIENANVLFENNIVKCSSIESNKEKGKESALIKNNGDIGISVFWTEYGGGKLCLKNNSFYKMKNFANINIADTCKSSRVDIQAYNNLFCGGTSLFLPKLEEGYFKFHGNCFMTDSFAMFLHLMPSHAYIELYKNVFKPNSPNSIGVIVCGYVSDKQNPTNNNPTDAVLISHENTYYGMNSYFDGDFVNKDKVKLLTCNDTLIPPETESNDLHT